MNDPLYQDQIDIADRLQADEFFADVPVLVQRKGVTESDIETALGALNEKTGKAGACLLIVMPELVPDSPDAPGPRYRIRAAVQAIEMPLINLGDSGTGKSAESLMLRARQVLHHCAFGRSSTFTFAGMDPATVPEGQISYAAKFERLSGDEGYPKLPTPIIAAAGTGPITVTLSCADGAAELWYSADGSYPWAGNTAAYLSAGPITITTACTLRAVAYRSGYQASNVASAVITPA